MAKGVILRIDRLPDLSMTHYRRRYGDAAADKAREVLVRVSDLLPPDGDEWVGLRFQHDPRRSEGPDRLKVLLRIPTVGGGSPEKAAFVGSHLVNAFYQYKAIAGPRELQPARLRQWHVVGVSKAEEAELRSDEGWGQQRFYYVPLPMDEARPALPMMELDGLFDSLRAQCVVQITARPRSLTTTTFRDDVLNEIQDLDRWASGFAADRATTGTLESLSRGRDMLAARARDFYRQYFDRMFSGRVYEFAMLIASRNKSEASLLARAFGEDFFGQGGYYLRSYGTNASGDVGIGKALRDFGHFVPTYPWAGGDCWSHRLAERAEELRPILGERLGRHCRLSHLSHLATKNALARMLQLPASQGVLPRTIRIESETAGRSPSSDEAGIVLGTCTERGDKVQIPVGDLTRHAFLSGMTGGGKTVSLMNILVQLWRDHGIPWLLVEPVKGEYRTLCAKGSPIADDVRIFTVGNHHTSPLSLNPFEVPKGVTVDEQISSLEQCFAGAFSLGGPLPYLLAEAIHRCYEEAGYDLDDEGGGSGPWPTMHDLARTTRQVVEGAGYGGDLESTFTAALSTRIRSLCERGIGRVLAVRESIPSIEEIMARPTILETLAMTKEQANLLSLFLITRARQWIARNGLRDQTQDGARLRHLLCIEEAHNLVGSAELRTAQAPDDADPQRHTTELMARILKEVRALGESIIICSQSPASVHPEIMRQTNLKLAHYAQDRDDRDAIACATTMGPWDHEDIARLEPGEAFVYYNGLHRPKRLMSGYPTEGLRRPTDAQLRAILVKKRWFGQQRLRRIRDELLLLLEQLRRRSHDMLATAVQADSLKTDSISKSIRNELREAKRRIHQRLMMAQRDGAPAGPLREIVREAHRLYHEIAGQVTRELDTLPKTIPDSHRPKAAGRTRRSREDDAHQQVRVPRKERGKTASDRGSAGGASGDRP